MLLALATGLTAQAAPVTVDLLTPPTLSTQFELAEPSLDYRSMPTATSADSPGWVVTGLGLMGGGLVVMAVGGVGMAATDVPVVDTVFGWVGLFGAIHFVVGASMLGIEFMENDNGRRLVFTGNGVAGRF